MKIKKIVKKDNMPKLMKILKEVGSKSIKIGIFGADDSHILMIARVQEFGCDITITEKMRWWLHFNGLYVKDTTTEIHIPERSFIRKTYDEKKGKIDTIVKDSLNELITFKIDINTFYDRIGTYLVGLTQETLTEVDSPPNHPFTLRRKAPKDNPLIDSGRLRESITFKVE